MMLKHIIFSLIALFLLSPVVSFSQQLSLPASDSDAQLTETIRKATTRIREYKDSFKDLAAEETQKTEEYDNNGLKRRREVISDLIIYQSPIDNSSMAEYRNVRVVDGKAVNDRDRRAEKLFERLSKADSRKKELGRIDQESKRYNLNYSFSGFTLNQALPLDEGWSSAFRFAITGSEQIDEHDVIVIEYEQITKRPEIEIKLSVPDRFKGAEPLYRGRLWLDRETARLRREIREIIVKHSSFIEPLTFIRFEFNYSDSRFDILTPKQITISSYTRGRDRADGSPELLLGGRVTFDYSGFRRFDVVLPDPQIIHSNKKE